MKERKEKKKKKKKKRKGMESMYGNYVWKLVLYGIAKICMG